MILRRSIVLLILLLVAAVSVCAQGSTLFSAPISVSSGVENVPGADGGLVPETTVLVKPIRPLFAKDTARTTIHFSYAPEFELVRNGDRSIGFWNHAADFAYGHMSSPRTRFTIGHSFVKSTDALRTFQDSLFVLSRNRFRQNSTVVSVRHDVSRRTSFGTRFDNTITKIGSTDKLDGTYLNGYGVGGTVSVTRHLTQRQKITGSYSALKFSPYRFPIDVDPDSFLSTLPTVRAGISRFALSIGLASAETATTPSGMLGGSRMGNPTGSPGTPGGPSSPGVPAPALGPIAALDSRRSSGPVLEGLPSSPQATPSASVAMTGPLVGSSTTTSKHSIVGIPRTTVSLPGEESSATSLDILGDPFHVVAGTYTYRTGPGLTFSASGGAMTDRDVSYMMGGQVEKSSDRLWMSFGVHHFISLYGLMPVRGIATAVGSSQPPGTRAKSDYSAVTLTVDGKVTSDTEVGFTASLSRSTANFVQHRIRALVGNVRVNHWLSDRFGIFATVDSVSEDRVQPGTSAFNRQRYFGGIQIRMAAPRSSRGSVR